MSRFNTRLGAVPVLILAALQLATGAGAAKPTAAPIDGRHPRDLPTYDYRCPTTGTIFAST
jgi:hypothetical protein